MAMNCPLISIPRGLAALFFAGWWQANGLGRCRSCVIESLGHGCSKTYGPVSSVTWWRRTLPTSSPSGSGTVRTSLRLTPS